MENYKSLKKFIFFLLILYFIVGITTFSMGNTKMLIPFFSWFLYITVPNQTNMYAVRIYEYHGKKFDPPIFFHESKGIFIDPASGKARELIQKIGNSLRRRNNKQAQDYRKLFEDAYLTPPNIYEIVRVKYDPIKLWNKKLLEVHSIKRFTNN